MSISGVGWGLPSEGQVLPAPEAPMSVRSTFSGTPIEAQGSAAQCGDRGTLGGKGVSCRVSWMEPFGPCEPGHSFPSCAGG